MDAMCRWTGLRRTFIRSRGFRRQSIRIFDRPIDLATSLPNVLQPFAEGQRDQLLCH